MVRARARWRSGGSSSRPPRWLKTANRTVVLRGHSSLELFPADALCTLSPFWGTKTHIQKHVSAVRCSLQTTALWKSVAKQGSSNKVSKSVDVFHGFLGVCLQLAQYAVIRPRTALRRPNPPCEMQIRQLPKDTPHVLIMGCCEPL